MVRTLADEVDAVLVQEPLLSTLSSAFGLLALLLTGIGLHGVLAFLVVQRTREVAGRMALGAQATRIVGMIAREAVLLVGVGVLVAVPVTLWLGRALTARLSGLLFGLAPDDTATLFGASALLIAVGVAATVRPARRASTLDPIAVLRSE